MALTHTSSAHSLLSYFAVFLAVYLNSALVHGRAKETNSYQLVDVDSLLPKPYCTTNNQDPTVGSSKLKVTYKYGPCAPIGHAKEIPSSEQVLLHDEARIKFMNDRISNLYPTEESNSPLPISTDSKEAGIYTVTIKMGTPQQDYSVSIDTGSDITWLQCQPCSKGCYSNPKLRFDPSKSSTYVNGSCKSNSGKEYNIYYNDKSYSRGQWGCDTLTLEPSDVTPNFEFGCGQYNSDEFGSAVEVGMLGLGRGPTSLLSQTASQYGKTFVYCFPGPISSTGYLLFGDKAKSSYSAFKFTPLLKGTDSSLYFLELVAISVGGMKLKISPSVFRSQGTIIDSGTVITRLPAPAYSALKSAFKKSMSKYPSALATDLLDTCYNLERYKKVNLPKIVFHFGGRVDVTLHPSGTVWTQSKKQVCLGFAPTNELTIIGNNQQHALEVLYDTEGGRIGFANTGRCGT
ncbi:unnamed protein product [Ilex paraguariensis]|uniref:Peptidase A1 domain-containing protein n=1 Tax=Ilex paraguariensis TaxID=185542 RepID=A0ABC8RUV2_9AQUA